ncbi:MAG: AMP-binding protein [Gammaproteobacteria bacterium]
MQMQETGYGEALTRLAAQDPERVALYFDDEPRTIGALERRANRLARTYQSLGVRHGRIVTIAIGNSFELLVAMFAAWKIGALPNPVSPAMPREELAAFIDCADSALIVGVPEGIVPGRRSIPLDYEPDPSLPDTPLPPLAEHSFERALGSGGSTGRPKVVIAQARAVFGAAPNNELFKPDQAVLVPGPIYHAVPFSGAIQGLMNGCTVIVMKRFDAEKCLALIARHRIDRLWVVPTMLLRIWRLPEEVRGRYDVSCLKNLFSSSAPLPDWLFKCWIDWLGPEVVNNVYGPSERIGCTMINGRDWLEHPGSVGKPLPFCRMRVLNEQGEDCAPGQMGEIYFMPVAGVGSSYRYLGAESRRTADGWESVGDMGYVDADGWLYLGDRRADMILLGGRNIYPAEVEAAIEQHPAVRSCAVIGLPDEELGNRIHAIIDTAGAPLTAAEMADHLKPKLTYYKIPSSFEFVDISLRSDAGKLRRSALRAARL